MSKLKYFLPAVGLILFAQCKTFDHLAMVRADTLRVVTAQPDSQVSELILPYKSALDAKMNEVIATAPETLTKGRPESTLTNWVADALYNQASKHFSEPLAFAYQNFGGIRISTLGKGAVSLSQMFEIMPFDNLVVLLKLKGTEVQKFLDYVAEAGGAPVSSQVSLRIENKKAVDIRIQGKAVEPESLYYVVFPDYVANGGDNLDFLRDKPRIEKNILIRDILTTEAREKGSLRSALDQRITIKQ